MKLPYSGAPLSNLRIMTLSLDEFLIDRGYRRHVYQRNAVGHLVLAGEINRIPAQMLVDTGASKTVVDAQWCQAHQVPLVETGRHGGGAGGVELPIYTVPDVSLTLDGIRIPTDSLVAIDLSHVNRSLAMKGGQPLAGVIGADVLRRQGAVLDYATDSLYLRATDHDFAAFGGKP